MKEELPMNVEEQLIELIKGVSDLNSKVDTVQKSVDDMRDMAKTITAHGTAIGKIEESLKRGETKFDKIDVKLDKVDARLDELEKADGEKAKLKLQTVGQYILIAIVGAIVANIPTIINTLGGK